MSPVYALQGASRIQVKQGFSIVILASAAFLGYISLREQLIQGGRPAWLEQDAAAGNIGLDSRSSPFCLRFGIFHQIVGSGDATFVSRKTITIEFCRLTKEPNPLQSSQAISRARDNILTRGVCGGQWNRSHVPDLFILFGAANGFADVGVAAGPGAPPAGVAEPALAPTSTVENRSENASFAEGLDQSNGWHRTNAEGDVDGAARESHGPFANEPDMDGAATDGDWPGVAEDAGEIGEAMNWDRLLGLDGSLAFLEHVLWLIALDTLFIVIFGK
ncbi:hypothetical protein FGIG_09059 [Fasciola gigantica]|uniref:RING-type E3 ubiquitin transferase n=1 Tax=Fasciola gigantica TaxID=46835 RepID=A0A504ZDA4_FASGI|nr:hypothetical protein FGIG_09059 [Fasciola gigantica]